MSNLVNFKTFGFTKIVPRVAANKFESVVNKSASSPKARKLWKDVRQITMPSTCAPKPDRLLQLHEHIYAVTPESSLFIGKRNLGHVSNYYLGIPIADEEVAAVQTAAEKLGIDVLNTRYVSVE